MVLDVVDRVKFGQRHEDSRVELKADWIEPKKAARLIAAHANAARGEPILWIIGLDERRGVLATPTTELANWFAQVESEFDGVAPGLEDFIVPVEGGRVTALLFDTTGAPFVVKTGLAGSVTYEVPWREGTRVRSARRSDLIRLISPLVAIPAGSVEYGSCSVEPEHCGPGEDDYRLRWDVEIGAYLVPRSGTRVVVPRHLSTLWIEMRGVFRRIRAGGLRLLPPEEPDASLAVFRLHKEDRGRPASLTIRASLSEALVDGPGMLRIRGEVATPLMAPLPTGVVLVRASLGIAGSTENIDLQAPFFRRTDFDWGSKSWWVSAKGAGTHRKVNPVEPPSDAEL